MRTGGTGASIAALHGGAALSQNADERLPDKRIRDSVEWLALGSVPEDGESALLIGASGKKTTLS
jgi:hypothetical protein